MPVVPGPKARRLVAERQVLDVVLGQGFPDGRREGGGGHSSVASTPSAVGAAGGARERCPRLGRSRSRRRLQLSDLQVVQGRDVASLAGAAVRAAAGRIAHSGP